jgi:hypothetical protein
VSANYEQILKELSHLPPEAQQRVMDYILLLRTQYAKQHFGSAHARQDIDDEPFVGMWRDRDDMEDSSAWVKKLRNHEWA